MLRLGTTQHCKHFFWCHMPFTHAMGVIIGYWALDDTKVFTRETHFPSVNACVKDVLETSLACVNC